MHTHLIGIYPFDESFHFTVNMRKGNLDAINSEQNLIQQPHAETN